MALTFAIKAAPVIEHYLKIFGTLRCIVPNITLSLFWQIKKI